MKTSCLSSKWGENKEWEEEGQHDSHNRKGATSSEAKPYLRRVLHPIHRVLRAGLVVGAPVEVDLAQPVGPAEWPPGQH